MLPALLKAAQIEASDGLVRFVHHDADKSAIAALAPEVTAAALSSDPLALDILKTGAAELALLVKSVVERSEGIIKRKALILAGGVMEHDEIVTDAFVKELERMVPGLSIVEKKGNALDGACLLARTLP
jgi:N-acetylglucosamine kinase-like BadF-type ATPase